MGIDPARRAIIRSITEDELLSNVVASARLERWLVYHVRNSRAGITQGDVGFPDVVLCRPPRLLVAELKRESGKVTPAQMKWLGDLANSGVEVRIWRPSDWFEGRILRELRAGSSFFPDRPLADRPDVVPSTLET